MMIEIIMITDPYEDNKAVLKATREIEETIKDFHRKKMFIGFRKLHIN